MPRQDTTCEEAVCYADRGHYGWPRHRTRYEANLEATRTPGFVARAVAELRGRGARLLRIHSSGDFYSAAYVRAWSEIMAEVPEVTAWAYTRSWRLPEILDELRTLGRLANVRLWFSADRDTGIPPEVEGVRSASSGTGTSRSRTPKAGSISSSPLGEGPQPRQAVRPAAGPGTRPDLPGLPGDRCVGARHLRGVPGLPLQGEYAPMMEVGRVYRIPPDALPAVMKGVPVVRLDGDGQEYFIESDVDRAVDDFAATGRRKTTAGRRPRPRREAGTKGLDRRHRQGRQRNEGTGGVVEGDDCPLQATVRWTGHGRRASPHNWRRPESIPSEDRRTV